MAIGNRQIGWSQEDNLLWEISKQLDTTLAVLCTGPCPTTTSTTTTVNLCHCYTVTNLEIFSISCSYTNCNGEPVSDFAVEAGASESFCALFDSVFFNGQIIDNGICGLDCSPVTTTTTTTTIPLVFTDNLFEECSEPCGAACGGGIKIYYNVWMTQECIDTFPTLGCEIWYTEDRTVPFPNGTYNLGNGACIVITGGIITDVPS